LAVSELEQQRVEEVELQGLSARWKLLNKTTLLILPSTAIFIVFFVIPVFLLFAIAFNPSKVGFIKWQPNFALENFVRFFSEELYYGALVRSVALGMGVGVLALILGYPLAYVIAKTRDSGRNTFLMILVLVSMQLDIVIRIYGLMITLGDTGLINSFLARYGFISEPLPLMYNTFGVVVGLVQFTLPFMILSLVGIIRSIDPFLEEAARSLGASRWRAFFSITFPLSLPGVLAGFVLVFALAISSYVVPVLMGGWKVVVLPMHIYQQIAELGYWQFGSAVAVLLFGVSLVAVYIYNRLVSRYVGGMV
jgi:putative spermidine/putrescine transport system permease protein